MRKKKDIKNCLIYMKSGAVLHIDNTNLTVTDFKNKLSVEGLIIFNLERNDVMIRSEDVEAIIIGVVNNEKI